MLLREVAGQIMLRFRRAFVILPVAPGMTDALIFHALLEFPLFQQPKSKPIALIIYLVPQFLDLIEEETIFCLTLKPGGLIDDPFPSPRYQLKPL
jgi:hypothetical protein